MRAFISRNKLRLFIGLGFLSVATAIINYLTFAKVWSETFTYYGIPSVAVYIGLPIIFVISCWGIGYAYEFSGLWAYEVSHQNTEVNPEFSKICSDITEIKKLLSMDKVEK